MRWAKARRVHAAIAALYLAFLGAHAIHFHHFGTLYDAFLFYFDASYDEFRLWFPNHHLTAYAIITAVKISAVLAALALLLFLVKKREWLRETCSYNDGTGYAGFVKGELALLCSVLTGYLMLYGLARACVPEDYISELQVLIARGFLLQAVVQALAAMQAHTARIWRYLRAFLFAPADPRGLAVLRILFFTYLAFLIWTKQFSAMATVGLEHRVALPGIGWLVRLLPVGPDLYAIAVWGGVASALLSAIGWRARLFMGLCSVFTLYVFMVPNFFGKLWHEQMVIWICWLMALSRCHDALSVDAALRKKSHASSAEYGFPIRMVWLQFAVVYLWAGFYKLWDCGFDWALGPSMVHQVQLEWLQNYDLVPSFRIDRWPVLLHAGGLAAVLFELLFPIAVLHRPWRWAAVAFGIGMHLAISAFMYINFFYTFVAFYIFFFPFRNAGSGATDGALRKDCSLRWRSMAALGILLLNFLCGMLAIDSYPFSAYPRYAALVPAEVSIIRWQAHCDGRVLDAHAIGESAGFRWEDHGWTEHNILRDWHAGTDVSDRMDAYWAVWRSHIPSLDDCDSVRAVVVRRPVAPEGKGMETPMGELWFSKKPGIE